MTPKHVAIVMDGNGRWAVQQQKPRVIGHEKGAAVAREIVLHAAKSDISVLSLFAFSQENWGRPQDEVNALMQLFFHSLKEQSTILTENNIRLKIIGDTSRFDPSLQDAISECESLTINNDSLTILMAVNYSGRWDITQATQQIVSKVKQGVLSPDCVDEDLISQHLSFANLPDPDLYIRTSGEQRISNFMLWQLAYAELYFTETLWPDFTSDHFDKALLAFKQRQRRFGLVVTEEDMTC